jgi:hypothetical protein
MDVDVPENGTFQPQATASGRQRRFPHRFRDYLPSQPVQLPHMPPPKSRQPPIQPDSNIIEPKLIDTQDENPKPAPSTFFETEHNEFGLFRRYPHMPSYIPDEDVSLDAVCDDPGLATAVEPEPRNWWSGLGSSVTGAIENIYAPFMNMTTF